MRRKVDTKRSQILEGAGRVFQRLASSTRRWLTWRASRVEADADRIAAIFLQASGQPKSKKLADPIE
jgi:hypothetical protein